MNNKIDKELKEHTEKELLIMILKAQAATTRRLHRIESALSELYKDKDKGKDYYSGAYDLGGAFIKLLEEVKAVNTWFDDTTTEDIETILAYLKRSRGKKE